MAKTRLSTRNLKTVMSRFVDFILTVPPDSRRLYIADLNTMLDEYVAQDAFGTEAQLDPRGDQRD